MKKNVLFLLSSVSLILLSVFLLTACQTVAKEAADAQSESTLIGSSLMLRSQLLKWRMKKRLGKRRQQALCMRWIRLI